LTTESIALAPPAIKTPPRLQALVMSLFFAFGFCTVLVDTLIPKLKATFSLNYTEVMLTQFCFFGAYFIVSLPASRLLIRIGFLQSVTLGLGLMALGCLLFTPAANAGVYEGFLAALFILASGVTIVQVAANPLAATAGDPSKASALGPLFGAALILSKGLKTPDAATLSPAALAAARKIEAHTVQLPFLIIATVVIIIAIFCWTCRDWVARPSASTAGGDGFLTLMKRPRLALGTLAIFVYVGAEVSIGSTMANYLMSAHTLSAPAQTAGSMVSIYWGLAMVGRFIGAGVLGRLRPGYVLAACATGAIALVGVSSASTGMTAAAALLAVGLWNSIMFPTIFALAIEGLGERSARGSGLLSMAIVGGAIVPMITGRVADSTALNIALAVPAVCYAWILIYGLLTGSGAVDRQHPIGS
jgi:FHS family L-fucose permease-like MFS transporter